MRRGPPFRLLAAAAAIALAIGATVIAVIGEGHRGPEPSPAEGDFFSSDGGPRKASPDVVVLMLDDLGRAAYERALRPEIGALLEGGTEFTDGIVSTPLCCPSRAAFLSGRYGHNNGILENDPGYPALDAPRQVLPVWMKRAGYRTALVGKFKNGWERTEAGAALDPAPGWDEWFGMLRTFGYYDYELNENGEAVSYGSDRDDYLTDVLTGHAVEVIERAPDDEPLFMWVSWWAPHPELSEATGGSCRGSAIPPAAEPVGFEAERLPGAEAALDEADVADKPAFIRRKRDLRPGDRHAARASWRCRLASLGPVADGIEAVREALAEAGRLDRTMLILTSDNGFFHLEHRLPTGKGLPYEEAIGVPLVIDLPKDRGRQPARLDRPVSNIDLAPTILKAARAQPCVPPGFPDCATLDGRELLAAARGRPDALPGSRPLLIEAADGKPCPFAAVRTRRWMYAEHERVAGEELCPGEAEMYDLRADLAQAENLLARSTPDPPRATVRRLRAELARLRDCSGVEPGDSADRPACG